jgi:hypothetical protein
LTASIRACANRGEDDHEQRSQRDRRVTRRVRVDRDATLAELEWAWAAGGYHGFSAEDGAWCAVISAGEVLTRGTPDELARAIRGHWQAMQ